MVKINEDVFKRATDDANLKTKESPTSEKNSTYYYL
jgi:hypothetical protein